MAKTFTITDFFTRFPTHNACLDHLMMVRYGETVPLPEMRAGGEIPSCEKAPGI